MTNKLQFINKIEAVSINFSFNKLSAELLDELFNAIDNNEPTNTIKSLAETFCYFANADYKEAFKLLNLQQFSQYTDEEIAIKIKTLLTKFIAGDLDIPSILPFLDTLLQENRLTQKQYYDIIEILNS